MASPVSPAPLVGRARERTILRKHLADVLAGRGGLVLISGEAGIGKTALAENLLTEVRACDTQILIGRCYDLTEPPSYGLWGELFGSAPRPMGAPALPAAVLPAGQLGEVVPNQEVLIAQVQAFIRTLVAVRPLVLLLEDLHWADYASLDLLRTLGRDLAAVPLLVLATYRTDEINRHSLLATFLPTLIRETNAARLELRPLLRAALQDLIRARYTLSGDDEERLVMYLVGRTDGNPFYVGEVLRTLEEEGALLADGRGWALGDLNTAAVPALLRQVIDGRVDRLGAEARQMLTVAAVIGQEVPLDLWMIISGVDEAVLLETLERAIDAHVLVETPDGVAVRFTHALVREALYHGTLAPRRRVLHRDVAEALLADPVADPDEIADHLRRAGDQRAAEWLERAGLRAQRSYDWRAAVSRFEAALVLRKIGGTDANERGWLLVRIARLLRYSDPRRGMAHLDEALNLALSTDNRALAAVTRCHRGQMRCLAGDVRDGLADLVAGTDALETLPDHERARLGASQVRLGIVLDADLRGTLTLWLALAGRYSEAVTTGERVVAASPSITSSSSVDDDPRADAWYGLGVSQAALGCPDAAHAAFAEARVIYGTAGHQLLVASAAVAELVHVTLPYAATDLTARVRLSTILADSRSQATGVVRAFPLAATLAAQGYLDGSWEAAREGWAAGQSDPAAWRSTAARLALVPVAIGRIARAQGDRAAAQATVDRLLIGPDDEPGGLYLHLGLGMQSLAADLALDVGNFAAARVWLMARDRWLAWSGAVLWRAEGALGWAAYYRAAGDYARARDHATRALAYAVEPCQPLALLATHRLLGELAIASGDSTMAARHLGKALALADACSAPYEAGVTLLALAELYIVNDDRAAALRALIDARTLLEPLLARPTLARAEALAARLGVVDAPPVVSSSACTVVLTVREIDVLRLMAEGLPNRAIGARLAVSPRTVSTHLEHIYTKFDVTTRTAAVTAARRAGVL